MALQVWESQRCANCGSYDSLVPLPLDLRHVTWAEYDNRKFAVTQYRCLACASRSIVERDWNTDHEKDKPTRGAYMPADGRQFIPRPSTEED